MWLTLSSRPSQSMKSQMGARFNLPWKRKREPEQKRNASLPDHGDDVRLGYSVLWGSSDWPWQHSSLPSPSISQRSMALRKTLMTIGNDLSQMKTTATNLRRTGLLSPSTISRTRDSFSTMAHGMPTEPTPRKGTPAVSMCLLLHRPIFSTGLFTRIMMRCLLLALGRRRSIIGPQMWSSG